MHNANSASVPGRTGRLAGGSATAVRWWRGNPVRPRDGASKDLPSAPRHPPPLIRRIAWPARKGRPPPPAQTAAERKAWWRPRLATICSCATCSRVLEGFAQKIINEERGAGRWPEHDAADLVQRAACRALKGKLKRPDDSHPAPAAVAGNGRGVATNSPAKAASRACPNGCDGEAMRLLCKRIRNDCKSSTRTRQTRDRASADVVPIQTRDPADRLILRVDLESAVEGVVREAPLCVCRGRLE